MISFKTAKLAKEKEYPQKTESLTHAFLNGYHENGLKWGYSSQSGDYKKEKYITAPSQTELQGWIRENHHLHPVIIPTVSCAWTFKIVDIQCDPENQIERPPYKEVHAVDYTTYEEALEEALYEMLTQIK